MIMAMKKGLSFLLSAIFMFLGAAVFTSAQNAIDFSLKNLEGQTVRLKDYIGKNVILIDFWATWCVPCVKELPHFQEFHNKYREQGLLVLAITVDGPETVALVKPFMERYKYTFPVLLDIESRVIALYNPRVIMPYTLLIDRQGRIRYVHQGYSPGDEKGIEEELLKLLQEEEVGEARKFSLSVNEAFLNRFFSDDEYVESVRGGRRGQIINRLDVSLATGNFLFGIRADADLDFTPWENDFSLAKRFFEYTTKNFSLRLGDYYYSVGRGLILSVLKTFEKEGLEYIIDTTIDGGKASFNSQHFFAEIYGGWIDRELLDVKDKVFGGILGFRIKDSTEFKLNFLGAQMETGTTLGDKDVYMGSLSLDIPSFWNNGKFYGEFVLSQKEQYFKDEKLNGHGIYLESSMSLGNFTLLFEFKDYLNLAYEYNRPPMLESEHLPIMANQFAKDAIDITGFTGRIDYYLSNVSTLFWIKSAFFKDTKLDRTRDIFHVYGGVEKRFKETGWLNIIGGYRKETTDSLIFYYTHGNTYHYQLNLSYPLTAKFSLEADTQGKEFRGENLDYYERRSFLSLHYSKRWVLTFLFDQTNDPQVLFFRDKKNWFGVQLEIKFLQANSVRIFYGAMKGGVKCSGGVCRFFPPFEGFRLDAIIRF